MIELLLLISLMLITLDLVLLLGDFMGGIRRRADVIFIQVPFRDFPHEEGEIELTHGKQEIFVPTSQEPVRVWICYENEGVQCCLGDIDVFSTSITPEGFVLIANVNSESAFVKWIADFV